MMRSLRAYAALVLSAVLLVNRGGFASSVPTAAATGPVAGAAHGEPALHAGVAASRVEVDQHRRVLALVAVIPPARHAHAEVTGHARRPAFTEAHSALAAEYPTAGYDATAPPLALS